MANNYSSFTVTPSLAEKYFTEDELNFIEEDLGITVSKPNNDSMLYLYAKDKYLFTEYNEDVDALCDKLFEVLKRIPVSEVPFIVVEGTEYCSRMHQGEFGGFAYLITREDVESFSTFAWVEEKTKRFRK